MEFITSVDDLADKKGKRFILVGDPVFVSLDEKKLPKFIKQPPISLDRWYDLKKTNRLLNIYVDESIFKFPFRFAFAEEGYVKWGMKNFKRGHNIIIGGAHGRKESNFEVFVWKDAKLIDVLEKTAPPILSNTYRDTVNTLLEEFYNKYSNAKIFQAAPLESWNIPNVEYIGDKPLKGLSYRPLVKESRTAKYTSKMVPALLTIAGVSAYGFQLNDGWTNYQKAVSEYDESVTDPTLKRMGGVDPQILDVLSARNFYMNQPRRQTRLAEKMEDIVVGVGSIDRLQILEIRLPAPNLDPKAPDPVGLSTDKTVDSNTITNDRSPDFWMEVEVPATNEPALDQANSIMTAINQKTGHSLRLAHEGWRTEKNDRIFNLEGFIHASN